MKIIGKVGNNYITKIGIILSASKYVSIKPAYQYLHIINNKEILNGLNDSTKSKRENCY